jgi:ribosomal protein L37AE/L43A
MSENKYDCPYCHTDLRGEPIPDDAKHLFGGLSHFSALIGVYSLETDRTTHYRCPACNTMKSVEEWGK